MPAFGPTVHYKCLPKKCPIFRRRRPKANAVYLRITKCTSKLQRRVPKMASPLALLDATWLSWLLAIAVAFASYVIWSQTYWLRRGVAQTRPRFLLGDLFDTLILRRTVGSVLVDIYRRFEGRSYVGIYKFLSPVLLLRDADVVKEVLIQNFASFQTNATVFPAGKEEVFCDNPFVADVERWKELRSKLSQTFTPGRVRVALPDILESGRLLAEFLEGGKPDCSVDGMVLARRFTAHASMRVMFGIESHSLEVGSEPGVFYELGNKVFNGGLITTLRSFAFFNYPPLLNVLGYTFVADETVSFFRKLLQDCVEYRSKENISRDDFVQHVAKQILVDGKIDEAAMKRTTAQAINTYVESFETSGITVAAALLMLATNPRAQDKVREELRAKVPAGKLLPEDAVGSLPYLEQAIYETLRHYPPLDAARRMCTKTTTLRDPAGSSPPVTLQPGDLVYVPVDALHRDPAFYSHPDQFRPEHFSAEEVEKRHKCAFQGFGDGPRQCPGMRYAMQQVKVALASVLLRFEVTAGPEQVLPVERDPEAGILGFKGGVWLRFRALP